MHPDLNLAAAVLALRFVGNVLTPLQGVERVYDNALNSGLDTYRIARALVLGGYIESDGNESGILTADDLDAALSAVLWVQEILHHATFIDPITAGHERD